MIAGVEVGSTKTCVVLVDAHAGREPGEPLTVLGVGTAPSRGMTRSRITHLDAATSGIRAAMGAAERMAGREIESVYVAVPAASVELSRSRGVVAVSGSEIGSAHVKRVQEVGRAVPISPDRELIHALCQEYFVDGRGGIRDPLGIEATRLEADLCIVTADAATCRDLGKAVDRSGVRLEEFALSPLVAGLAVLDDQERAAGVALVDMGGASTDALVYADGRILHAATLPWGGMTVTRDIARGLGVPAEEAERLKLRFGSARRASVDPKEQLDLSGPGSGAPRRVSRELLAHIIEQRLDEILGLVYDELEEAGVLDRLGAGFVLTGATASLPEMEDLARSVFNAPIRLGIPRAGLAGATDAVASPAHATAVGLGLYGAARHRASGLAGATRALARVGGWLKEFF